MVQKAVNAKAKAGLRSGIMVWDSDACCSRGHPLSHNTSSNVQTQGSKDFFRSDEIKSKDLKSAPSRNNMAESLKKDNKKDKKKRSQGQKRKHTGERKEQTPATNIHNTNVSKKKKKRCDVNVISYLNCDKKDHFASNCTKPKN